MPRKLDTPAKRKAFKEYQRMYKRMQREEARDLGRCPTCVIGRPERGYVTCDDCIEAARDRQVFYEKPAPVSLPKKRKSA